MFRDLRSVRRRVLPGWLVPIVGAVAVVIVGCADGVDEHDDHLGAGQTDLAASCEGEQSGTGSVTGPLGDLQAVGDSILGWHMEDNASIPDVVGRSVGETMTNHAVGGATVLGEDGIPSQYEALGSSHVLFTGGGNDVAADCSDDKLERILSADGQTGRVVELADQVAADGGQLVVVGYYLPSDREPGCPQVVELVRRYRRLGEARDDVVYVCTLDVITPDTPELYAAPDDPVHPSIEGSRRVGERIAEVLTSY